MYGSKANRIYISVLNFLFVRVDKVENKIIGDLEEMCLNIVGA